ncbi:Uncharacterised protein [uncultured archaeon]|nr:Uncharacterised protein [uncultured archaeon]
MASEAQIEANQENGKLGGVKTGEGKNISKYNAIKHGILCQEILLEGEDEQSLIELGEKMRSELKPETEIELLLVDRIVANAWRLKRVLRGEKEMIKVNMSEIWVGKSNFGASLAHDFIKSETYNKLTRYETSIERGIYKALHELQRLQAQRKGDNPPLPVAIDVDISKEE